MEFIIDIVLDACIDTLWVVPFLFVTYLVMEWLEHKSGERTVQAVGRAGVAGPAVGALLGAVPQCGFSAAASTFYAGRVITLGTLIAVFLSTSDEMLPIFIAKQVDVTTILAILGVKIVIGMVCGFIIDAVLRATNRTSKEMRIHDLCQEANCACEERCAGDVPARGRAQEAVGANASHGDAPHEEPHGHDHAHAPHDHEHCTHEHGSGSIVLSAVKHTLQIAAFVLVITLILNVCLELIGDDALASFVASNKVLSVFASALVGLIPNCAASVLIADLYVEGILGVGAMLAGLLPAAGVGLLVLLRTNRNARENIAIIVLVFAIGVVCGLLVTLLGF